MSLSLRQGKIPVHKGGIPAMLYKIIAERESSLYPMQWRRVAFTDSSQTIDKICISRLRQFVAEKIIVKIRHLHIRISPKEAWENGQKNQYAELFHK